MSAGHTFPRHPPQSTGFQGAAQILPIIPAKMPEGLVFKRLMVLASRYANRDVTARPDPLPHALHKSEVVLDVLHDHDTDRVAAAYIDKAARPGFLHLIARAS